MMPHPRKPGHVALFEDLCGYLVVPSGPDATAGQAQQSRPIQGRRVSIAPESPGPDVQQIHAPTIVPDQGSISLQSWTMAHELVARLGMPIDQGLKQFDSETYSTAGVSNVIHNTYPHDSYSPNP